MIKTLGLRWCCLFMSLYQYINANTSIFVLSFCRWDSIVTWSLIRSRVYYTEGMFVWHCLDHGCFLSLVERNYFVHQRPLLVTFLIWDYASLLFYVEHNKITHNVTELNKFITMATKWFIIVYNIIQFRAHKRVAVRTILYNAMR